MMQTWQSKHPHFEYIFWCEAEIEKRGFRFRCQKQIDKMQEWNGKADIMRWEILHHYGGYFVDADSICIEPFDDYFEKATAFATFENEALRKGLVATGTMGFVPGHPLCRDIIDWIVSPDAIESLTVFRAWGSVGPHALTNFLNTGKYPGFSVYPSHCFLPVHYTGEFYEGHKKVYAYQLWGNTNDLYDSLNDIELHSKLREPSVWISVLMPFYNTRARYLTECLESILQQKGHYGIELVIVNDGSNEEATNLLETAVRRFEKTSRFCRVVYRRLLENGGVANALNVGLELCSCDLVFRMDADDLMLPERIRKQMVFMEENPGCVVCGTNVNMFCEDMGGGGVAAASAPKPKRTFLKETQHPLKLDWETFSKEHPKWFMNHPTLCFRKSAVMEVGAYDASLKGTEDYDLEIRLLKKYGYVCNLKESLVLYRIHGEQITQGMREMC
jgi:GT2 family glycosyltransferase